MAKKSLTARQQFWLAHIQAAMRSGARLQDYAKAHHLSIGALYNAKSVFKRAGWLGAAPKCELGSFVPVRIQTPGAIRCRLQCAAGWQLEMERLPDPK